MAAAGSGQCIADQLDCRRRMTVSLVLAAAVLVAASGLGATAGFAAGVPAPVALPYTDLPYLS